MKLFLIQNIRIIRYFFIGVSAASIDLLIYILFINKFAVSIYLATTISIAIATVYGFSVNAFLNFKVTDRLLTRLLMYSITSFIGWTLSLLFLFLFAKQIGLDSTFVKVVSLPVIFIVQYMCNKKFAFAIKNTENKEHAPVNTTGANIAVIGGGFSGLTAAYDLAKSGHNVTIFEFNDHLGGLAAGFDLGGYPIERAYHFLYQSDVDLLLLSEELGIRDKISFYPSAIKYFYHGKHYPFTTPLDLMRFAPLSFVNRIRLGVVSLYLKQVKNWRPLSETTAYDWLNKWMGKSVTKEVWEPLLKGKFNLYYDKITMSWLWGRLNIRARSQNKDFSGEKLGYPKGGFRTIVDAIVSQLNEFSVSIKLNTGIQSISKNGDESTFNIKTQTGEEFLFDSVVATVPSPVFAKMINNDTVSVSGDYISKLNSVDYLDAVVMVFRTTQEITDTFWYNIKDDKIPFLTLLSTSALAGTEQFGGSHIYFVGAYVPREHHYMQDDFDIETEWKEGLRFMFPDIDESQIQELKISKFKDAQHIVDIGYEENKLVPFETPEPGLYLANFSQIYPDDRGTNFAVRDGRKVADCVLEYLRKVK